MIFYCTYIQHVYIDVNTIIKKKYLIAIFINKNLAILHIKDQLKHVLSLLENDIMKIEKILS